MSAMSELSHLVDQSTEGEWYVIPPPHTWRDSVNQHSIGSRCPCCPVTKVLATGLTRGDAELICFLHNQAVPQ